MNEQHPEITQNDIEASNDVLKLTVDSTEEEIKNALERLNKIPYWRWYNWIDKEPLTEYDKLSKDLLENKKDKKYLIAMLFSKISKMNLTYRKQNQGKRVKVVVKRNEKFKKDLADLNKEIEEEEDDDNKKELIKEKEELIKKNRDKLKKSMLPKRKKGGRTRGKLRAKSRAKSRKKRRKSRRKSKGRKRRRKNLKKRTKRRR